MSNLFSACLLSGGVFFVLLIIGLVIAPSIVWIVIGFQERGNMCNTLDNLSVSLPTWLIVNGFTFLFTNFVTNFLGGVWKLITCGNDCCYSFLRITYEVLGSMYVVGWLVYGAILVSDSDNCKKDDSRLYNTALAAVIIGYVWIVFALCMTIVRTIRGEEDNS